MAWRGVSYGILLQKKYEQNYEGLCELCWEVFRGYFLWFSEISLREKAAAGDFCEALVIFWCYSRGVVVVLVAGARQWEIPVMVNLRRDDNVLQRRKRTRRLSSRFQEVAGDDAETEK